MANPEMSVVQAPLRIWLPSIRVGTGSDVFVERLAEGLARRGHAPVVQWFPPYFELMPWRLGAVPAPPGVDVVHAASWQAFAFVRPGLPLVVTEHHFVGDPAFAPYRSPLQALYHRAFIGPCLRRSYRNAAALVAVSSHTAAAMEPWVGFRPAVIHNWVDTGRFTSATVPHGRRPFRLLFVGNPSRRKGADLLPQLARALGSEFEVRCLGGLREAAAARGPANLLALPRVRPEDMPSVYHQVDAVLVPTRYEAFGYVALEAMSCGLPVVGFDSTGTAEVCVEGETALLAPAGDVDGLLAACRRLAGDPALCRRLGEAGRRRAEDMFSEEMGISAYVDVYRQVIARGRGAG